MRNSLTPYAADELVPDGATIMIGGFMGVSTPVRFVDALVARGARELTIIANVTVRPGIGIGKLISAGAVSPAIVFHNGTNSETRCRMLAGDIVVELVPLGTLAKRVLTGGSGLGGVLTTTALGTIVAEGKTVLTVGGREFLIEEAFRAAIPQVAARSANYAGNLASSLTARNFNPLMALAAGTVIAEPNEIVPASVLSPDIIHVPGIPVDHLVKRPLPP